VKRLLIAGMMVILGSAAALAQSIDDLNLQVHGYATQGFIYSTHDNWNTTNSSDGSAAWTEAVVNLSVQPESKLHIGVQARYSLLGDNGNMIALDWAQADYKVNEFFGFRVGKVKSPSGMLNETQDIDPGQLWVLLPQSIYPLASRNSILSHYGGVIYGKVSLGEKFGKIEYRGYGGERVLASDDGYFQSYRDQGVTLPNGIHGPVFGGTIRWNTPIQGLMVGVSEDSENLSGEVVFGPMQGMMTMPRLFQPYFFGKFERKKVMVAGEYNRLALSPSLQFPGLPASLTLADQRNFYAMASYRVSDKLTGGLYYSSQNDLQATFDSDRYQKDWALTARYDFNSFLYAKAEQHWIDGTGIGFSASDNSNMQPNTRMTLLKLGVSF